MGKRRNKKENVGLYAKNYAKPVQWKLDMDYLDTLSDAEKEWLSNNLQAHYGARADHALAEGWDYDSYRESARYVNAARRDTYARREAVGQRVEYDERLLAGSGGKAAVAEFMAAKHKDIVEADYPLSEGILWTKTKAGWVVSAISVQGPKVTGEEVLTRGAVSFTEAALKARTELPVRLMAAMERAKRS